MSIVEAGGLSTMRDDLTVNDPETESLLNPPFDPQELHPISTRRAERVKVHH